MLVMYYSMTGNVKRFTAKLEQFNCVDIKEAPIVEEKFILITGTSGFGQVPNKVVEFLSNNADKMLGVVASGNKNWGENQYARSGDLISETFNVPLLMKIENSGFPKDVELFKERVFELYGKMD